MNKFCFPLLMIFMAHNYAEDGFTGFRMEVKGIFNVYEFRNYTNLKMFYRYLQDPETNVVYAEYNINALNITRCVYNVSNMSVLSPCFTCDWKTYPKNKKLTTIVCTRWNINETILDNRNLFSFRVKQTDSYPGCSGILLQGEGQFNFTSDKAESCDVSCDKMLTKTEYLNNTSSTDLICNTTTTALKWSTTTSVKISFSKTANFITSTETSVNVAPNKNRADHENNIIPIVIGVVCGLVLIASVIIGVILYRRKKTKQDKTIKSINRNNTQQENATNNEHTTVDSHIVGLETLDTFNNNTIQEIWATQIVNNQEDLNKYSNDKSHFRVELSQLNFNNLNDDYMVMSIQTRIDTNKHNNLVDYPTISEIYNNNKNELENDPSVDQIDHAIPQKTKHNVQKVYNNEPVDKVNKRDYAKLHDVRREHTHPYNGLALPNNAQDVDKEHSYSYTSETSMNASDDNTNLNSPHYYNITDDEKRIDSDNKPT